MARCTRHVTVWPWLAMSPGRINSPNGGGRQIATLRSIWNLCIAVLILLIMNYKPIRISIWVWMSLMSQLRRRGNNERESGAFLLSRQGSKKITKFICYDDLDPTALDSGIVVFHGECFVPLWEFCRRKRMRVIADIHTHPTQWTGQSESDRTHPMIGQKGHVSLIAPNYARENRTSIRGVGMYEYAGNHEWVDCSHLKLSITLF